MDVQGFLVPVLELAGVLAAAVLLVSGLVGAFVLALRSGVGRGMLRSYRWLLALRILVGYRREGGGVAARLLPVSSQNFIAMVGTAIGVWALIVVLSVMGGFEADLKGKIVRQSPHVEVLAGAVGEGGSAEPVGPGVEERLRAVRHVVAAEAYVVGEAMVTSSVNMGPGMTLVGVRPGGGLEERWLAPVSDPIAVASLHAPVLAMADREMGFSTREGRATGGGGSAEPIEGKAAVAEEPAEEVMPPLPATLGDRRGRVVPGIVLGEELARSLSVATGDTVRVVVPDGDVGPMGLRPRIRTFRVAGTFMSGLYEYDLRTAFLTLDAAEDLLQTDRPNRIGVLLDDVDHLDEAAADVRAVVGPAAEVRTVARTHRALFSALKVEKVAMFLVLGFVILVAAFNIFGSLVLITLEKTRDIAVIRCLGATRRGVRAVFLILGGVIGAVGTSAGLVLGLGACGYIRWTGIRLPSEYYLRTLPVEVRADEVALVVLAALGAALVATLYPAGMAARLSPADGLRND